MDNQTKQTITNLVELAILSKKILLKGSYKAEDMSDLLWLDQMCDTIIETYTVRKDNEKK
jgi:hypothetical protein